MTVANYLKQKEKLSLTLSRITTEGKLVIIEDDIEYTEEQFRRKYPMPMSLLPQKENADKTKAWLRF